ncbi:DUF6383 domain-containing protein [Parabacteroides chongii]|uniref:DUF6383 domain-containing protein n=1 Tax=Parabacteroides chongii TaxID=2685834 RepID=UPI00240DCB77|nr:DUF6383 domain-containing protein [Parabacteroides chongii]WFE85673.1 DUF6383 domain-containing protein [Parabacteroides chongii]
MNKKFSTLLASLLLAGAVVVPADLFAKVGYANGKTYATVAAVTDLPSSGNKDYIFVVNDGSDDYVVVVGSSNNLELKKFADVSAADVIVNIAESASNYTIKTGGNTLGFNDTNTDFGANTTDMTDVVLTSGAIKFATATASVKLEGSAFKVEASNTNTFAAKAIAKGDLVDEAVMPTAPVAGQLAGYTANSRLVAYTAADGQPVSNFLKGALGANASFAAYDENAVDAFYWTFKNGRLISAAGKTLAAASSGEEEFVMVPVKGTPYFQLKVAKGDNKDQFVGANLALVAEAADALLFASVEPNFGTATSADDMNDVLGNGFDLTIAKALGSTATVEKTGAFSGVLEAVAEEGSEGNADKYYRLKKGDKYVALNLTAKEGLTTDKNAEGTFELIAADKLEDANYYTFFHILKADNGEAGVKVVVADDEDGTNEFRLYISSLLNTNVLSAASEAGDATTWAYVTLGGESSVDLKTLLKGQFIKVNYVKTGKEATADKYKVDGILSVRNDANTATGNAADYVAKSSVIAEAPEAQWALTYADDKLTLTNRENTTVKLVVTGLRTTDNANVYEVAAAGTAIDGDLITITFVENHTKTDGYKVVAENVLRNQTFYLGQSRQTADGDMNAYWAENHGTHQIGATVDENLATKWNLNLVKKSELLNSGKNATEIDSVLVVSTMNVWDATKEELTEKKDTLVILPYAFQNRENSEFVKMNDDTKLKYYICDENNLDNKNRVAQRFALKKKPNDTYNYVTLVTNTYNVANIEEATSVGTNKVYQANSTDKGTWADMWAYAGDANALMVVKEIGDPEYRKIDVVWGDTISIYRQENEAQKLYEKGDAKSVVNNDTLSFLNIDNEYQFKMNPAIFADTAYINRGTGDDTNTCYQYLLAVEPSFGYHTDGCGVPGHPQEVGAIDTVYGRFLVNLIDTANIYGATHLHNNPYINKNEAGENCAKLSFVEGYHVLADQKLYIPREGNTDLVFDLNSPAFNVVKFAFRYVDNEEGTFKIQTQWKEYAPAKAADKIATSQEGYLKWINGTVVVTSGYANGDVFNMNEGVKLDPVANETIDTASAISVVAIDGAVIIKGAEGKKVSISNVLGQTIANTVVTSSEATISAPAGVVVVAVEGEAAVKAIVK